MITVTKEADGYKVTGDEPLYCVQSRGLVVIAPMRPKTCQVTFYAEEEWAKAIEAEENKLRQAIGKAGLPLSDSFNETGDACKEEQ